MHTGLSVRAGGGGFLPAIRVWCAGYGDRMKADIKSSQPEVKASKSVERFQRYMQLKFSMFLYINDGPWALKHELFDL